jgi:hypothetical protein
MSTDFGAELDAALSGHLAAVRAAADAAKEHVDESIAGVPDEPDPVFAAPPGAAAQAQHGAAVNFDLDEAPLEFDDTLDHEGIPLPEDI